MLEAVRKVACLFVIYYVSGKVTLQDCLSGPTRGKRADTTKQPFVKMANGSGKQ